jgi:hypothetical protein
MSLQHDSLVDSYAFDFHSVEQFLASESWSCEGPQRGGRVWRSPSLDNIRGKALFVPVDKTYVDYSLRLQEAIGGLSRHLGVELSQLTDKILSARADIFFVRLDQNTLDGTIPLSQATDLIHSIEKMVRAAATTAANPRHSHVGKLPRGVNHFMEHDVRMGHTRKGSFIITVVARLDDEDAEHLPQATPQEQAQVAETSDEMDKSQPMPYTRRVMTTLSRGLQAVHRHVDKGSSQYLSLDEALDEGVSLPLVRALRDIGSAETLKNLDMSFQWSPCKPVALDVVNSIVLNRSELMELPSVEEKLKRKIAPVTETIMGQVASLERGLPSEDGEDNGVAVLSADVRGNLRRVRVPLTGDDYVWAIIAHHQKLVYSVEGTLTKKGRSWELTAPIIPDTSHLQHKLGSTRPQLTLSRMSE